MCRTSCNQYWWRSHKPIPFFRELIKELHEKFRIQLGFLVALAEEASRFSGASINPRAAAGGGGPIFDDEFVAVAGDDPILVEDGESIADEGGDAIVIEDDQPEVGTETNPIVIEDDEWTEYDTRTELDSTIVVYLALIVN